MFYYNSVASPRVEVPVLEDGHEEGEDEEGQPAGDEGAGDDGQRLGGLPLALGLQGDVLLLLAPEEASWNDDNNDGKDGAG